MFGRSQPSFGHRRAHPSSGIHHQPRRRRSGLEFKSGARASASECKCWPGSRLLAPASAATQRLLAGAIKIGGIIVAMRFAMVPPTPNHSFKRTLSGRLRRPTRSA
jgi:hypothetical protein